MCVAFFKDAGSKSYYMASDDWLMVNDYKERSKC